MSLRAVIAVCGLALLSLAAPTRAYHDDTIECRSSGYKYNECEAPFRHPQLIQQLSDSDCVAGKSWGYNRDSHAIWVSDGCAGTFSDSGGGRDSDRRRDDYTDSRDERRDDRDDDRNDGRNDDRRHRPREEVVECRSSGYAYTRCDADWGRARLVEQLSDTRCVEGQNWGIDEDGLWVDKGCAGRFAGR